MYLHSIRGRGGEGGRSALTTVRRPARKPGGGPAGSGRRTLTLGMAVLVLLVGLVGFGRADWNAWSPIVPEIPSAGLISAVVMEPAVAVDDEDVHLAFSQWPGANFPSHVVYNHRTGGGWVGLQQLTSISLTGIAHEPDIAVWPALSAPFPTYVYAVWSQSDPVNSPYQILLKINTNSGAAGFWGLFLPISLGANTAIQPAVAVDEDHVYVAYAQALESFGLRIVVAVLNLDGSVICRYPTDLTPQYWNDQNPTLVVEKSGTTHIKNLAFQRQPTDASGFPTGPWEVYTVRGAWSTGGTECDAINWSPPIQRSLAPDDSLNPSLAGPSAKNLHLVYEDHTPPTPGSPLRLRYLRSPDGGLTWTPVVSLPITDPTLLDQTQPSAAGCGDCGVGVAWTQQVQAELEPAIYLRWSKDNGVTWSTPIRLSMIKRVSTTPDLGTDASRLRDPLVLRFHAAWDANGNGHEVQYRQSDTDQVKRAQIMRIDFPAESGSAAAIDPGPGDTYIFGGVRGGSPETYSNEIWKYDASGGLAQDTSHWLPSIPAAGQAWMPAVWRPGAAQTAHLFWGVTPTGAVSDQICSYRPAAPMGPVPCTSSGSTFKRFGASAVFDGGQYVYLFGGSPGPYPNGAGTRDILRADIASPGATLTKLCSCLPGRPTLHSAAVWVGDSTNGVAYLIQGVGNQHLPGDQDRYVIKFDPSPFTVEIVAKLPSPGGTGWGDAGLLESADAGDALSPEIAVNGNGDAVTVWYQWVGSQYLTYANRYDAGVGWRGVVPVGPLTFPAGDLTFPHVSIDAAGDAMIVWMQAESPGSGVYNIWAARYPKASPSPQIPVLIETGAGHAQIPRVAVDASGRATAVWSQYVGTPEFMYSIFANRYTPGSGWGTANVVENYPTGNAADPEVGMDSSGAAIAVWRGYTPEFSIYANRFVPGTGWGDPVLLEGGSGTVGAPHVSVDPTGNAMAVWEQTTSGTPRIFANRFQVSTLSWLGATQISSGTASATNPQVTMAGGATAMAVFKELGTKWNVKAIRYDGSVWQAGPTLLEFDDTSDAASPHVAMNGAGIAFAVWTQGGAVPGTKVDVWAKRYNPAFGPSGWNDIYPGTVLEGRSGATFEPRVGMDSSGNALAVWEQKDGSRFDVWANRYLAGAEVEPPPSWKFSATYDVALARVFVFGGGSYCIDWPGCPGGGGGSEWYYDVIHRFDPATGSIVREDCLRLPSKREGTSAVWRGAPPGYDGASAVFGGSTGRGAGWSGIGEVVHVYG